jgi:hypothetical protein
VDANPEKKLGREITQYGAQEREPSGDPDVVNADG